ncbi:hypothetical protein CHGG_01071 [Chaetomium globosum CBS 148.51]|uniref:Uncharacterized protein n=1 Tax=Chaetomium globosum (strain ATCC 6205 / CBS 148.51 / DSM 1962 / NBRC 6347 / NRRL 1970) TaxID=306901 RepID=Q2HFD3_CHAGB|nr:uncharacterized protein CHGG_01071 [Chaetomium globosum CBS 148.51]EAQ92836.1 hypothetical protein CHGG_01071 [Chaetomium globosum CBS 148.51]
MAAVAPMDLVVRSDPNSIPLRCSLCPKKPSFSDLSHLLTHISSKSHLAHRFKAELKARDDRVALDEVRQYDNWCEQYGINALLAERMAAKEQKKTGRRGRQSVAASTKSDATTNIDQDLVKPDPDEYIDSLAAAGHWAALPGHFQDAHHGHFDSPSYPTPFLKRSRSDHSVPSTPENDTRAKYYRRWPSETETADSVPVSDLPSESTEFDDENDASKLKGVRYPGMGLFDSADEIQKRMRNQRKDDSVLKQMEETSSGIVPNEFIWAEDGEFQRVRDIYASPSIEGSPDRKFEDCDVPKPKRGRRSAATAASGATRTRNSTRLTRQAASRNRRTRHDDNVEVSGSVDNYDIFRDPPKTSAAQVESSPRDSGTPLFTSQPPSSNTNYFQQQTMGAGTFNPLCVQGRGGYYNPYGFPSFGNEAKPSTTNFQAINAMNLGNMGYNAFGGPFAPDSAHGGVDQDFDL